MAVSSDPSVPADRGFVGGWLVDFEVGEPPRVLQQNVINPLFADCLATFLADGNLIVSGVPMLPAPDGAISSDVLLVSSAHGRWAARGERAATVRCVALLY